MGLPLVKDAHTEERLKEYYRGRKKEELPDSNWKQALIPEAVVFEQ